MQAILPPLLPLLRKIKGTPLGPLLLWKVLVKGALQEPNYCSKQRANTESLLRLGGWSVLRRTERVEGRFEAQRSRDRNMGKRVLKKFGGDQGCASPVTSIP